MEGPFEFSVTGVVASFASPLADAGIGVLIICTYDTDYLLVQESDLEKSVQVLSGQGHQIDWQINKPR